MYEISDEEDGEYYEKLATEGESDRDVKDVKLLSIHEPEIQAVPVPPANKKKRKRKKKKKNKKSADQGTREKKQRLNEVFQDLLGEAPQQKRKQDELELVRFEPHSLREPDRELSLQEEIDQILDGHEDEIIDFIKSFDDKKRSGSRGQSAVSSSPAFSSVSEDSGEERESFPALTETEYDEQFEGQAVEREFYEPEIFEEELQSPDTYVRTVSSTYAFVQPEGPERSVRRTFMMKGVRYLPKGRPISPQPITQLSDEFQNF